MLHISVTYARVEKEDESKINALAEYIARTTPPTIRENNEKAFRVMQYTIDSAGMGMLDGIDQTIFFGIFAALAGSPALGVGAVLTAGALGFIHGGVRGFVDAMQQEYGWP